MTTLYPTKKISLFHNDMSIQFDNKNIRHITDRTHVRGNISRQGRNKAYGKIWVRPSRRVRHQLRRQRRVLHPGGAWALTTVWSGRTDGSSVFNQRCRQTDNRLASRDRPFHMVSRPVGRKSDLELLIDASSLERRMHEPHPPLEHRLGGARLATPWSIVGSAASLRLLLGSG